MISPTNVTEQERKDMDAYAEPSGPILCKHCGQEIAVEWVIGAWVHADEIGARSCP